MENQISKKTRLLIATPLYPPEIGGPAAYVKFLEENLPKDQFDIEVIQFADVKHLPYIIRHAVFFWKIFRRAKYADIVYALDPLGVGLPAGIAAKLRSKKFLLRIAGDRAWETAQQKFGSTESLDTFSVSRAYALPIRVLKFGQTLCAKMAIKIIVPGEYLSGIVANWGIKTEKIVSIYNAFVPVSVPEEKSQLRETLELSGTVLLSAGRMVVWKGFETLIRMMPEVLGKIENAKLYIAGEGPDEDRLKKIASELGLEGKVVFLGALSKEDVSRYLKAADIFILNTFYEGFSHQLLEAMSAGTPVVSTVSGGNPELIENEKEGLLVPYDNRQGLFRAIFRLANEEGLASRFSKEAKEKSLRFSAERAIREFAQEVKNI
ncbi:MAG: glycosyltransferase family 4 protein [Candidatus Paceibacterota bacterium]|jgi:glycosyltransferase involved in cell wall biosynthesis